jgi:hypothetical protein
VGWSANLTDDGGTVFAAGNLLTTPGGLPRHGHAALRIGQPLTDERAATGELRDLEAQDKSGEPKPLEADRDKPCPEMAHVNDEQRRAPRRSRRRSGTSWRASPSGEWRSGYAQAVRALPGAHRRELVLLAFMLLRAVRQVHGRPVLLNAWSVGSCCWAWCSGRRTYLVVLIALAVR